MGPAGINGKTVLNGSIDPTGSTGTDGDFYINTATNTLFGPKAAGVWPAGVSLVGPAGPSGSSDGWALSGNANAAAGTNFLGTTNSVALEFRVNNERSGYVHPTNTVTSFGRRAANTGNGTNITAIGVNSLSSITTSNNSTAVGANALAALQSGSDNTAMGSNALSGATTGSANSAFGNQSLYVNTTGAQNTAMGASSLLSNSTGSANTAVGWSSVRSNTTGSRNVGVGISSLQNNSTGFSNVAVGSYALFRNTEKYNLVAVGDSALYNNGFGAGPNSPIEGIFPAMFNTAVGSKALYGNTTGNSNSALGRNALFANTSGSANTANGTSALGSNTFGSFNTAVGVAALGGNTTGSYNTAIGYQTGNAATTQNNYTALGYAAGGAVATNRVNIGNTSVTYIGGQVGLSTYSDGRVKNRVQENVAGLDFILRLRPVTYHFDLRKQNQLVYGGELPGEWEGKYDLEQRTMTGFIAQEVEAAAKACGYDFSGVHAPEGNDKLYSLTYAEFVVPLVKAVQEQQATIEDQQRQIEELRRLIGELRRN